MRTLPDLRRNGPTDTIASQVEFFQVSQLADGTRQRPVHVVIEQSNARHMPMAVLTLVRDSHAMPRGGVAPLVIEALGPAFLVLPLPWVRVSRGLNFASGAGAPGFRDKPARALN